ncbi:Ig-like domain-containing protein [Corallococcus exercitus]|uniref:Ig-like domain-containing protein n=1 Tax=Corallococcus exercitus TaxID=2316736 RepID=A0A7Y4JYJ8_9BACT|nr:Ig-like domain-containing protein [Corallococcus exercitus]NOK13550.1 Ig-like domain-containing protein [Corallococcus exercitus]
MLVHLNMKNFSSLLLAIALLGSGCIEVPEIKEPPCAGVEGDAAILLRWKSPNDESVTRDQLSVQVELTGPTPSSVELLVDGVPVSVMAEPYALDWDTGSTNEGTHELTVRARRCGREVVSAPRRITVDRTGPRVMTVSPENGSTQMRVKPTIELTLSERVVAATVNGQGFALRTGGSVFPVSAVLSQDGKGLTLRPVNPLPINATVELVLSGAVTDAVGNPLELPVQGLSWFVPSFVSMSQSLSTQMGTQVRDFSFQLDKAGNPIVVWLEDEALGVHVRRWNGLSWETLGSPIRTGPDNLNATECVLGVDAMDVLMVAWIQPKQDGGREVHVRRWDGMEWLSWGAPISPQLAQAALSELNFRVDGAVPALAFKELNSSTSGISRYGFSGGVWKATAPDQVGGFGTVASVRMELGAYGYIWVVWSQALPTGGWQHWAGAWYGNGNYVASGVVSSGTAPRPLMASTAAADGSLYMAVPEDADGTHAISILRRGPDGGWSQFASSYGSTSGKTDAEAEALKTDPQGRLLLLSREPESEDSPFIKSGYLHRWDTNHWEQIGGPLSANPGATTVKKSQLALDKNGRIFLAWIEAEEQDPTQSKLHVFRPND